MCKAEVSLRQRLMRQTQSEEFGSCQIEVTFGTSTVGEADMLSFHP